MKNLKKNQSVILTRNGKSFIAKIDAIFSDCFGLVLPFNPDDFTSSREINGVLFSVTTAFSHEIEENKTGFTVK